MGQNLVGVGAVELVLGGTWQVDVGLALPRLASLEELSTVKLLNIGLADVVARSAKLQHVFYLLVVQSCGVVDVTVRTADGDDLGTQLGGLLRCTPCHIAEAGDGDGLALDVVTVGLQHLVDEVQCAVARSLRTYLGTAPFDALARQHALELVGQFLVLSVEIAYFAGSHADVSCRNILVGTNMSIQLCHECLAEAHHLVVASAADAEVCTALAAAHG